jgi:hypothetical protein
MKNLIALLIILTVLVCWSPFSKKPDNKAYATKTEHVGYKPNVSVNLPPVEVVDTSVLIKPTWGQAIHYAKARKDHPIWALLQILLLGGFCILAFAGITDASWLPEKLSSPLWLALLGGLFIASLWQSASIKWNNDIYVPKAQYTEAIRQSGTTQAIWDSLENGHHIEWGPYK